MFKVKREFLYSDFCNPGEIVKGAECHTQFSPNLIFTKFYWHAQKHLEPSVEQHRLFHAWFGASYTLMEANLESSNGKETREGSVSVLN